MSASLEPLLSCSFCDKSQDQVRNLIAGPGVCICDECVELCNDIIRDSMDPDVEGMLSSLRRSTDEIDELVQRLKDAGVAWDRIAEALQSRPGDDLDDDADDDTT